MGRPLPELELRAALPLSRASQELRGKCVEIARVKQPSSAYDLGYQAALLTGLGQMQAIGIAKATRWLALVRRDYGIIKFDELVRTLTTITPQT